MTLVLLVIHRESWPVLLRNKNRQLIPVFLRVCMSLPYAFQSYVICVQCEGEQFEFFVGNEVGKEWYDLGSVDHRAEMGFIRDWMIREGDLVVECGCHHGYTTILLSRWVGVSGRVIAFDARPDNAAIALTNVALNSISNTEVHALAVGSHTGRLRIADASNARVVCGKVAGSFEVPVVRLDEFLAGRIPDVVKIDVEGYEFEVLRGLQSTLVEKETCLAVEVHGVALSEYQTTLHDLLALLDLKDYLFWLGVGAQANEGITDFHFGFPEDFDFSRFYIFAIPKHEAARRGIYRMSGETEGC
ncbi:MAG: FkbM family methyltransferase [Anaerolineae bacterium]|nr:FkbM family methyltransferase [Anaerolineae bacterium]